MSLEELIARLQELVDDHGLHDDEEYNEVQVNGRQVIAAEWDGNTTIELVLGSANA